MRRYPERVIPLETLSISPEQYDRAYKRGWASSARAGSLDNCENRESYKAECHGWMDAWLDGWLDFATGRDKWHLRDCPDHDACGQG